MTSNLVTQHDLESGQDIKYDHIIPVPLVPTLDQSEVIKGRRDIDPSDLVTENETRDLRRGLAQRHVSMIALAGKLTSQMASTRYVYDTYMVHII